MQEKRELRARMKALRNKYPAREELDRKIFENFFAQPFAAANSFFVYRSFQSEADTRKLIEELLSRGKKVYLPRVRGREMELVSYAGQAVQIGAFGIEEPAGEASGDLPEVCVLPLLAADKTLARLGYGGGYYDRYLAKNKPLKVGLAYSFQIVDKVPTEPFDVRLDVLVTDGQVYTR